MTDSDLALRHYTDHRNLDQIKKMRVLRCALCLMNKTERAHHATKKRAGAMPTGGGAVLRDQQPLSERIVFSDNATLADFVEYLNGHVFFWPSGCQGEKARQNFCGKYQYPKHIGLSCQLSDLIAANPETKILFSRYNSGCTPRCPVKSPRSLALFQPLNLCDKQPLVEVVVKGEVRLPDNTKWECKNGQWREFFPRR